MDPPFSLPKQHKLEPHFVEPYSRLASTGSPEHASGFLKAVAPVIETGLRPFGGAKAGPALRGHARRIALDAARTYDPEKGPLKGHLLGALRGLSRHAIKQQQLLSVPEGVAIDHHHLRIAEDELRDELGRDPSDGELADRAHMSPRRMAKIRAFRPGFAQSQAEAPRSGEEGPGDVAVQGSDPTHRIVDFLYPDLDPVNQAIVDHHFGRNGRPKLAFTEAARRLNLSPGAVSQRVKHIQSMVDEMTESGLF